MFCSQFAMLIASDVYQLCQLLSTSWIGCNRNRRVEIPQRSWYNKIRSSPEGVSYYLVLVFCNHRVKKEAVGIIGVFEGLTAIRLCRSSESHSARQIYCRSSVSKLHPGSQCIRRDNSNGLQSEYVRVTIIRQRQYRQSGVKVTDEASIANYSIIAR